MMEALDSPTVVLGIAVALAITTSLLRAPGHGDAPHGGAALLWQLSTSIYLPTVLLGFCYGLAGLQIPLIVQGWGMDVANAANIKAVAEVAELAANTPASSALTNFGAKGAMFLGSVGFTAGSGMLVTAPNFAVLCLFFFIQSASVKLFNRGRGAVLKSVPKDQRGRTSGLLLVCRFGTAMIAPPALAVMLPLFGGPKLLFVLHVLLGFIVMAALLASEVVEPPASALLRNPLFEAKGARLGVSYRDILSDAKSLKELLLASGVLSCISVLRGSYVLFIPIAGLDLGMPLSVVSLAVTVTNGIAFVCSVPGGAAADVWGRGPVASLSMVLFSIGHAGLTAMCVVGASSRAVTLMAAAVVLGLADALSGPLAFVLKSDAAAHEEQRLLSQGLEADQASARVSKFFALMDILVDAVGIAYPILLSLAAVEASVGLSSACFAVLGLLACPLCLFLA